MKIVIIVVMFLSFTVLTKGYSQELFALRTGEETPNIPLAIINSKDSLVYIQEYKGKLIILDFWGTWCNSCVRFFPKLDTLQNLFERDLKIILVNSITSGDDKRRVSEFLNKRRSLGMPINLTVAVEDSLATKLFPNKYLPTYVWISPNGKLLGVTGKEFVTEMNIRSILETEKFDKKNN